MSGDDGRSRSRFDLALLAVAVAVVVATRLVGLERWPVYFFSDEAVQAVRADELLRHGGRDEHGAWLPTYFTNGLYRNLGVSVYLQTLPQLVTGGTFDVAVTRGASALVAASGAVAVALMLRGALAVRFWWAGALLLALAPAWFLHSRTAFETVLATTTYAWFLHFYLRYRCGDPRNAVAAALFGALTFYAYSPAQVVVVATALGLLASDFRYHLRVARDRPALAAAVATLLVVSMLPWLRERADHPGQAWAQLRWLDSYWTRPTLTLPEKLRAFGHEYVGQGLDPWYWYAPEYGRDLVRHRMKGYGNLGWPLLPFAVVGLVVVARRWRSAPHRAIVVALLAAPLGAALVEMHVTRALFMVVPATLVTALGLAAALELVARRVAYPRVAIPAFAVLVAAQVAMLADALRNGPLWYRDYGIGGVQYGAAQVFGRVKEALDRRTATRVHVSPTWANGTEELQHFFLPREPRVDLLNVDAFRARRLPLGPGTMLVMTPPELERARRDPRFDVLAVDDTIRYPDGTPGFHFVRLGYSREADAIFAAEDARRREPVVETIVIAGTRVTVSYSRIEHGRLANVFDGDPFTLVRGEVANPFVLDLAFDAPLELAGLSLTTGTMDYELTVQRYADPALAPVEDTRRFERLGPDPTATLDLSPPVVPVTRLRLSIRDLRATRDAKIHVRELALRQRER